MIRTALTLNISAQDAQNISVLANGSQMGLLSSSNQNIHVSTSHRPVQLIVAIRSEDASAGASLARQRQLISDWQSFNQILSRRNASELNSLMQQYHLQPDWLICLDEQRMQAWLPSEIGFYLLRQGELRRLKPTTPRDYSSSTSAAEASGDVRQYFSLKISFEDQFFLLPPVVLTYFGTGEAAEILMGLRQQPAKMSDLFNTARQRGFSDDHSWLALKIIRLEEDELPDIKRSTLPKPGMTSLNRYFTKPGQSDSNESLSESVCNADTNVAADKNTAAEPTPIIIDKQKVMIWGGGAIALLIIVLILILTRPWKGTPETTTTGLTTTTEQTQTQNLSPTPRPTSKATPTAALPQLTVAARQLNLREQPDRNSKLLKQLKSGEKLYQLAKPEGDWVKVKTKDGLIGYVYYSYVTSPTS